MQHEARPQQVTDAVVGMVIAGGRSIRFGGEKAVAMLAGRPLLMWAVARLQRVCRTVAVNARPDTETEALARAAGLPIVHDLAGDPLGPLSGVKVGLHWAREQGARQLAVSPCDVPMLPADLFARLLQAAGDGAALAETSERVQPLSAVWPVNALDAVTESLKEGHHPPTWMMLERLGAVRVRFHRSEDFANINTRIDLSGLAGRLEREAAERTSAPPDPDCQPHHQ